MIKNKLNNKVYIGQSDNIHRRWKEHKYRSNGHYKKWEDNHLYRSMRKYGIENFEFNILEECSLDKLNERETYYISEYNSSNHKFGYNKTTVVSGKNRNTIWTDDSLSKLKELLKDFNYSIKDIAKIFSVDTATIHYINRGDFLVDKNQTYPIRDKYKYNAYVRNKKLDSRIEDDDFKRTCSTCGKDFIVKRKKYIGKFCSISCSSSFNNNKIVKNNVLFDKYNNLSKEELEELIINKSFEEIGRLYNVSGKAISKLCERMGLPSKRSEINELYKDIILERKEKSVCPYCKKEFYINYRVYCSEICYSKANSKTRLNYPSIQEIIDSSFKFDNFKSISENFNIDNGTFRWYCKKNGIPTTIEELRNFKI